MSPHDCDWSGAPSAACPGRRIQRRDSVETPRHAFRTAVPAARPGERVCHPPQPMSCCPAQVVVACARACWRARGPPIGDTSVRVFTASRARLSNQLEVGLMSEATIDERAEEEVSDDRSGISRRNVLRAGAVGAAAVGLGAGKVLMQPSLQMPRPAHEGRPLQRDLDRPRRLALRRGLPDLAADPDPVHRPAADPAGGHAADAGRGGGPAAAARAGYRSAELVPQRDAPALAGRDRVPGPDRLQVRPARPYALVHQLAGDADRQGRQERHVLRRGRQHLPGRHHADAAAAARSTASTARSPVRGSTPSTASRCSSGSRTTWTRTR